VLVASLVSETSKGRETSWESCSWTSRWVPTSVEPSPCRSSERSGDQASDTGTPGASSSGGDCTNGFLGIWWCGQKLSESVSEDSEAGVRQLDGEFFGACLRAFEGLQRGLSGP